MVLQGFLFSAVATALIGITLQSCTTMYPYSYFNGLYCCQYKFEKAAYEFRSVQDAGCDGGSLGASSECCYQNEFIQCPSGVCVDNSVTVGNCPVGFPYSYWNGFYCCTSGMEKNLYTAKTVQGKGCDGSYILFDSLCCDGDNFVTCAQPPCRNYNNQSYPI